MHSYCLCMHIVALFLILGISSAVDTLKKTAKKKTNIKRNVLCVSATRSRTTNTHSVKQFISIYDVTLCDSKKSVHWNWLNDLSIIMMSKKPPSNQ